MYNGVDSFKLDNKILIGIGVFVFILVNVLLIFAFLFNFKSNVINETSINFQEYEEFDSSHICQMFGCAYIQNNNILYKNISNNKIVHLEKTADKVCKKIQILENMYITDRLDVLVEIELITIKNNFVVISKTNIFSVINNVYYYLLMFIITLSIYLFILSIINHKKFLKNQSLLIQHESYYKSMMLITENIHHELNTPLAVINNKVEKLKKMLLDVNSGIRTKENCDIARSMRDFDVLSASLIQITDLLNRMRPFKDYKHQTNRDLYTVLQTACDMSLVTQHERFDYEIEEEFKNYKLCTANLKNGEMTAIILNFIKNSVEANACSLRFKINSLKNNKLSFLIIDDGNGIPKNLHNEIFKENVSSKSGSRGNGLYANKFIINNSNGNISLLHSSDNGTIFEVIINVNAV
jgi:K+-sensing histidine kinase KdpD